MSFQQPRETLRQTMHRLADKFEYLDEDDIDYGFNLEEDTGYVRVFGIRDRNDIEDWSEGFDTITLRIDEQDNGTFVVTANYNTLPS